MDSKVKEILAENKHRKKNIIIERKLYDLVLSETQQKFNKTNTFSK